MGQSVKRAQTARSNHRDDRSHGCCDGNLMLGLGPQWNGEFTEAKKTRLFEIGDWLMQNGRSI